jgi:hypothetical protein
MKYTDYYSHLNEGWTTYKPSNNQKVLLYDFYVLSYLSTLPLDPTQKGYSGTLLGRNPNEIKLDIEYAQSVLLPILVKKLKNALFLGVCAELRHIFDKRQDYSLFKDNKLCKYYLRYYSSLTGNVPDEFKPNRDVKNPRVTAKEKSYLISYKAAMMAIKKAGSSTTAFAELARDLFKEMDWNSSYGGNKWAEIADGYLLLAKSHTNNEKQIAIDHAYDLQHNTGTALNKVKDFAIDTNFEWIQVALDHKRDAKSMYELLPQCSSDMRKLALEAFKIANVKKPAALQNPEQKPSGDSLKDLSNRPEFNVGDEVVYTGEYQGKPYKLYGQIVNKLNKLAEADDFLHKGTNKIKQDYKIAITKIKGVPPAGISAGQLFNIVASEVKKLKLAVKRTEPNTNNTIVVGEIYDVVDFGFLYNVDSYVGSSSVHGTIYFIYNLELFKKFQFNKGKTIRVNHNITLDVDLLTSVDENAYLAKDTKGFLLKVGNEYLYSGSGIQGQLIEIKVNDTFNHDLANAHYVVLKITKIVNEMIANAFIPNAKVGDLRTVYNHLTPINQPAAEENKKKFKIGDKVFFNSLMGNKYEAIVIDRAKTFSAGAGAGASQKIKITKIINGINGILELGDEVYADLAFLKLIPEETKKPKFKVGDFVITVDNAVKGTVTAIDMANQDELFYEIKITDVDESKMLIKSKSMVVGGSVTFYGDDLILINSDKQSKFKVGDKVVYTAESISVYNKSKCEAVVTAVFKSGNVGIAVTKVIEGNLSDDSVLTVKDTELKLIPEERKKYNFKIGDKVLFKSSTTGATYYGDITAINDSMAYKKYIYTVTISKVVSGLYKVGQEMVAYAEELKLIDTQPDSFKPGDDVTWTGETGNKYEAVVIGPGTLMQQPSKKIKITKVIAKASGGQPMSVGSTPSVYDKSLKHNTYI